jgi:hypothetical protein
MGIGVPLRLTKEEASALLRRLGFGRGPWARALTTHAFLLALFGVAVPLMRGLDFFDPFLLLVYASLAGVFAAPLVAHPFEEPVGSRVDARIVVSVVYGELAVLALLGAGIGTVYWTHRRGVFFPPELYSLATAIGFGFVLALALATMAAWITLRFSAAAARGGLRAVFFGLLLLFWMRGRFLTDQLWVAAAAALAVAAGFRLALPSAIQRQGGPA